MKKKLASFLITIPLLAAPALMAISCSNSSSSSSQNGNWEPTYDKSGRLVKYNYETFLKESTTGWDDATKTATIDFRALQKLSTSFPFTSPEFNFSSLDPMFSKMVADQQGVNEADQLKNQINIYSKLAAQSAFPSSLNTTYYSYSFMTEYFDGTTHGQLTNPGFYHARPTNAAGEISSSSESWNKLVGNFGIPAPANSADIAEIVKSIFIPGRTFPEGTKIQFNNSVVGASVKNTAQYYTHYLDTSTNTYIEFSDNNHKGWYLFQPVNEEGKGLQPKSNDNAVEKYIAPDSNRLIDSDISVTTDRGNIMIKTANLTDVSNAIPSENGAVSEVSNFGVHSKETPILEDGDRVSLMTPPIMLFIPKDYKIEFKNNHFVKPDGSELDIFSTDALEFIEPDQPWNIMFDAAEWTPSTLKIGSEIFSLANFDQHMQIANSYGTSSNLIYDTQKNMQCPKPDKFAEEHLGVPSQFVELFASNKLRFRKVTGGNNENIGSSSPILSAVSLIANASDTDSNIKSVLPVVQGSAIDVADANPSDNLFRISIDKDDNGKIDSSDVTYGFYGASADGKMLGPDSGFFKTKPLTKTDAHSKLINNNTNPDGLVFDISQWGAGTSAETTDKWNTLPDTDLPKTRMIGDFEAIHPINVNGLSITPLPKTNQDGNAVESYQGAGFQLLPIESVISNSSFIDAQSMGFVPYILDKGDISNPSDDHIFERKMYFDTENGQTITAMGVAKEKYRLPQILSGFYRDDAKMDYTEYATALNGGVATYNQYIINHTVFSPTNINARFVVPNESTDSRLFNGKALQSNVITESMTLHFEHGLDKMLLDRTRENRSEGVAISPVPIIEPSTAWTNDTLNSSPIQYDLSNKFAQQINFSGSLDNSPLEFISQVDGRNVNLFKQEIIQNEFVLKFTWGSTQLGEIRKVTISSLGNIINNLKIMFDDAFGLSDISTVPLKIYTRARSFERTAYTPTDLEKLFWGTSTNDDYVSSISGMPIAWYIAQDIDKMVHEDGFVPQEWGGA